VILVSTNDVLGRERRDFAPIVSQPEVMGRIGSAGITSGLHVIRDQLEVSSCSLPRTTFHPFRRAKIGQATRDTRLSKSSCPKLPTDRMPHPASRVRETKTAQTRISCVGTSWMEGKPVLSRPGNRLPLLTEGRGASLGYRGHKHEQTF
jgi:hypothetical protein